ncbi:MAG: hypothetical protein JSW47_17005, partial [Phycisphaerales bacterium]
AMDTQEIINMGRRAKSETEDFINRHLNDRAKGWPKNSLWGSTYGERRQERQLRKRTVLQT